MTVEAECTGALCDGLPGLPFAECVCLASDISKQLLISFIPVLQPAQDYNLDVYAYHSHSFTRHFVSDEIRVSYHFLF